MRILGYKKCLVLLAYLRAYLFFRCSHRPRNYPIQRKAGVTFQGRKGRQPEGKQRIDHETETRREADFTTVINTTFDSLKTTLVKSLPTGAAEEVPLQEEVTKIKPHEVGNYDIKHDPHIGTTINTHQTRSNINMSSNRKTHVNKTQSRIKYSRQLSEGASESFANKLFQTSLSYVDLKKEIEVLLPIHKTEEPNKVNVNNPRRKSNTRRQSKSFRQFPQIVVHPPDAETNITSSMPDIRASLMKDVLATHVFNNVSNQNASCPDLTDENIFSCGYDGASEGSCETDDVFENYDDSENMSVSSDTAASDFRYQELPVQESRTRKINSYSVIESQNSYFRDVNASGTKQKYAGNLARRKKKDEMPMSRVWMVITRFTGESNLSQHTPHHGYHPNYSYYDYPPSNYAFGFHNVRHNLHSSFGSMGHLGNFHPYAPTITGPPEATVPCLTVTMAVLMPVTRPIRPRSYTNVVVEEETFEEMLNRQKAELNALMEAHRKQQLEYMEFHRKQTE
ncbi:hypothetical protein NQ318_016576, partial [Aromia moschata]